MRISEIFGFGHDSYAYGGRGNHGRRGGYRRSYRGFSGRNNRRGLLNIRIGGY